MSTTLASPMQCVMTVRTLSIDGVQKANSGHPGAPMGLAPVGWQLFSRHLRHSPSQPEWPNRDRFVLSNGHASMLLYSLLHLTGYDLPMEEIKRFRQLHSITPGHPERIETPGVEVTTGPLGQGMSNAVGLALAEEMLAARYNRPGHDIVDHRTWFIAGDGCFMEGISHEAASLAGHLQLGKLIGIYDDNKVSLDAMTAKSYSDDVPMRFEAYGWRVLHIEDPNTDLDEIDRVMDEAQDSDGRPTLIIAPTHIGYGSPHKQDSPKSHGNPLGEDEVELVKEFYGWPIEPTFLVPPEVDLWKAELVERGRQLEREWQDALAAYAQAFPTEAAELERVLSGQLPADWEESLPTYTTDDKAEATRAWGGEVINAFAPSVPEFVQGAADLSGSTKTTIKDGGDVAAGDFSGRNIYFGVREHGMGAIANGMTAHGGLRVACSTFFQFYDYMKNTVRLAALMQLGTIFVYTHDSIGLGEDGPTHQQVENLAALRAVPNCVTFRPADGNEVAGAWRVALERTEGPTALVLSRQSMPNVGGSADVSRGAYVVADGNDAVLLATGSEVQVALGARDLLAGNGIGARVVSMPSFELFRAQDQAYRDSVLPPDISRRVSVEAASSFGWHEWVGDRGAIVGLDRFGESAPAADVMTDLGITPERVAEAARGLAA